MKKLFETENLVGLQKSLPEVFRNYKTELEQEYRWNKETTASYYRMVQGLQTLLDEIAPGKSFVELGFVDYEFAIDLKNDRYKARTGSLYDEGTICKFRNVLQRVCMFFDKLNIGYVDPLWDCYWKRPKTIPASGDSIARKARKKEISDMINLPKSLTIKAECKLARILQSDLQKEDGAAIGGLLMLYLGVRPGECCALKYDNIKKLSPLSNDHVLYIYEQYTTKEVVRNKLKTINAYRILPIPEELYHLIAQRKAFVETQVSAAENIEKFPMVNSPKGYNLHCGRKFFAEYMKATLRCASVQQQSIAYMSILAEVHSLRDAEPTAYLLRRNFATIMSSVCMTDPEELEYLMGHALSDNKKRNEYQETERLTTMLQKMNKRHLLGQFANRNIRVSEAEHSVEDVDMITIVVGDDAFATGESSVVVDVYNKCTADCLELYLESGTISDTKPILTYEVDARKVYPTAIGRISTASDYYKVMNTARKKVK